MQLPINYEKANRQERRQAREKYIEQQNGKCYWCDGELTKGPPDSITSIKVNWRLFPQGFLNYPVHLQHCHKTGMSEGAVHAYCNAVMWQYHGR